jgi:VanZ family protein
VENFLRKVGYGLPALITAGAMFYASSLERIDLPLTLVSFDDLLYHAGAYFFLGITLLVAAYPWNNSLEYSLQTYLLLGLIGMLCGLSDEIHQSFVPNRTCTVSDLLADAAGVLLCLGAARVWIWNRKTSDKEFSLKKPPAGGFER